MTTKGLLSRRTVLRGLGTVLALPWLEAMGTPNLFGASDGRKFPNRMAFLYVPNGKNMAEWTPKSEGANFDLPSILEPLKPVRKRVLVLTGLTADKARPNGDGPGDHARALSAFLTGCQARKTDGANIRAGVSVDQVAASRIGDQTRLTSLEIGGERGAMAGNCDSGYSCVYSSTMSWRSPTSPLPKEVDPRLIFDRLFGNGKDGSVARREQRRKSILDFVREDAKSLQTQLPADDQRKLEEYFTAVRDVERRIARAEQLPPVKTPDYPQPKGVPASYEDHLKILCDLIVLAFQADVTRIITFVLANEGSNRPYPFIGVSEGHHDLSHHGNNPTKLRKIRDINRFHVSQLAYLLARLQAVREGDGTLLDHCMIAYGSANSDGNAHNHNDLPILLAGSAGSTIQTGRHIRYPKETPLNNLWLAMLDRVGADVPHLGDGTGRLTGLA
jgi:Protein of unknown function (DUF1552)